MGFESPEDNDRGRRRQVRPRGRSAVGARRSRDGTRPGSSEDALVDVAILKMVGFPALGALVLGWLVVSFLPAGRAQRLTARLAAAAMYLALVCLFTEPHPGELGEGPRDVLRALRLPAGDLRRGLLRDPRQVGRASSATAADSAASATH